jgi:hypothetical protein
MEKQELLSREGTRMDEPLTLGQGEDRIFRQLVAHYDAPAYVRRAQKVQQGLDALVGRCRRQREEWLVMVRTHLGLLQARAGDWLRLEPLLAGADQLEVLRQLHTILEPRLRVQVEPMTSTRTLGRTLRELRASLERFNRRWLPYLERVDLTEVNRLRDGYNRYYLLEKECAVRSVRLAMQGFHRLEILTTADLVAVLPPLPVPQLKG